MVSRDSLLLFITDGRATAVEVHGIDVAGSVTANATVEEPDVGSADSSPATTAADVDAAVTAELASVDT